MILVSEPMMLKLPTIPYLISDRAQILFPLPMFVLLMQDLMPKVLQLPIFITLSFQEVGLNIITARSSITLQSPKIILKCSSFFQQMMEQVGLMMQPQPKTTLPTISLSPKFKVLFFLIIQSLKLQRLEQLISAINQYLTQYIIQLEQMLGEFLKKQSSPEQPAIRITTSDRKKQLGKYFEPLEHNAQEQQHLQQKRFNPYFVKAQFIEGNNIEGYTIVYLDDNIVYEGEYRRSKRNGYGIQYDTEKKTIKYEGYFRDDKYDGWGRTSVYAGQFRDGHYDGYGVQSTDTNYYEGFFYQGLPYGQGVAFKGDKMEVFHPVKNIIDFLMEGMKNNMDIFQKFKIDEIYLGQWKEGFKHGFGRLFKLNYWYSGQFSNDLQHGLGAQQTKTQKQSKVTQTVYRLGIKK